MCGIYGVISLKERNALDINTARKATKILAHRGPDDSGDYDIAIVQKAPWNQDGVCDAIHTYPQFQHAKQKIWLTMGSRSGK